MRIRAKVAPEEMKEGTNQEIFKETHLFLSTDTDRMQMKKKKETRITKTLAQGNKPSSKRRSYQQVLVFGTQARPRG